MAAARGQQRRSSSLRPVAETSGEPITKQGLEDLRAELADLEGPRRQAMSARIKVAREEGDLKENAEYHVAKEDQAHLETRIKRLRERLQNAVVIEASPDAEDAFAFGLAAEVLDKESGRSTPGRFESARPRPTSSAGRLSAESPIGRALLNAKLGKPVKVETPRQGPAPSSFRSSSRRRVSERSRSAHRRAASGPPVRAACRAGTTRRRGRPCSRSRRL